MVIIDWGHRLDSAFAGWASHSPAPPVPTTGAPHAATRTAEHFRVRRRKHLKLQPGQRVCRIVMNSSMSGEFLFYYIFVFILIV